MRPPKAWLLGTNTKLPKDIAVTWVLNVDDDFHARFSAESRTYQYLILNRRVRSAIFNGFATWEDRKLNFENMQQASQCFIGEHDFSSYRAAACQADTAIRTIHKLDVNKLGDWFLITICANAFLHHMVRNIAGVLMMIGRGKEEVSWAEKVLTAKDRTAGGVTAPPDGLYLTDIKYSEKYIIPEPSSYPKEPLFRFNAKAYVELGDKDSARVTLDVWLKVMMNNVNRQRICWDKFSYHANGKRKTSIRIRAYVFPEPPRVVRKDDRRKPD